jgi:hypothetical protein
MYHSKFYLTALFCVLLVYKRYCTWFMLHDYGCYGLSNYTLVEMYLINAQWKFYLIQWKMVPLEA